MPTTDDGLEPPADQPDDLRAVRSTSFGRGVAAYSARPTYPAETVAWLVPDGARDVVDLAAGTGKLTAGLVAHGGLRVTAVEPDDTMRATLTRTLPGVTAHCGTAEDMRVPSASADLVTVGQAWHWFEPLAATAEIRRVLRPGGRLGVVWNVVLEGESSWVDAYSEIVHRGDRLDSSRTADPVVGPGLDAWERHVVRWSRTVRPAELRSLAASRSHLIAMPEPECTALLDEVDALWRTHPDLVGRESAQLPYVTRCWRTTSR